MRTSLILFLCAFSPASFGVGDPVAGEASAIICISCHGSNGNSEVGHYPKLAGQGQNYMIKQLKDFKAGKRREQHMDSMVEAISMDDIPNITAWFSQQKRKTGQRHTNLKGKQLFINGNEKKGVSACAGCHGDDGKGNDAIGFPSLAGQHAEYLAIQLRNFRHGRRTNDSFMMQGVARSLSDSEIEDLAQYIESM